MDSPSTTGVESTDRVSPRLARPAWVLLPAVLVVVWVVGAGPLGAYVGKLSSVQNNNSAAFLPANAESTQVQELVAGFTTTNVIPAVVVYQSSHQLGAAELAAITANARDFAAVHGVQGAVVGPIVSQDGTAAQLVVPLGSGTGIGAAVAMMRADLPTVPGLTAHVTGPAGLTADLVKAFAGIDGSLVLVTGFLVFVILIVVYRSPLLPVVVLTTALLALSAAGAVVYLLTSHGVIELNGQSQGILFILVIGASTDYSLLLVARFREELRTHEHRRAAMRTAYRSAVAPILASGATVILGLLCLLFTDLKSTRGLGPVAAVGIAASLLAALTFLPAALVLLGRIAFWPARPRMGQPDSHERGVWARVSSLVDLRARTLWITITVVLLATAVVFLPQLKASGTKQTDLFLHAEDSVAGQAVLAAHFPAGTGSPVQIVTDQAALADVLTVVKATPGVEPSSVAAVSEAGGPDAVPKVVEGRVLVQAVLTDPADSAQAIATVQHLRDRVHALSGADALVGGATAVQADTIATSEHDRATVIPIVLVVILLVLMLLLRAVVAPLVLVATVVLSFAATLGVAALVFDHVLGFPGADPAVPLFAFVFLVALGVDYNIFLMSRVREESLRRGTRSGTLRGLRATGGVITSAGVVLAATFAALAVIPILFLAQIAFLVAFGVLLDTLVVRSLLVPAIVIDLDRRTWWPSRLGRRTSPVQTAREG
jgi:RND superfamily putative drug exporter